jgi:UDPglucose--hexose-1-phosphate uridylyltransferase
MQRFISSGKSGKTMAEIRRDAVSGRWVIIAGERASRPHDFAVGRRRRQGGFCPFCEGNEDRTPPEIAAVRAEGTAPDAPGWQVRVVPNKYPALRLEGEVSSTGTGLCRKVSGVGAHEVIIESPRHLVSPAEMSLEEFGLVIDMYCQRSRVLAGDGRLSYVLVFKNVGQAAGASLEHSHSQLIAPPVMPRRVQEEIQHCRAYFESHQRCLFCDIIKQESEEGARVALDEENFVVLSPYAARFPFEMWILPKHHVSQFCKSGPEDLLGLTRVLHETLTRLEMCLSEPPYNYAIHTAPVTGTEPGHYHWHVELIPRVTRVAGFEWGTGSYINPVPPEDAARFMREVPDRKTREKSGAVPAAQRADV